MKDEKSLLEWLWLANVIGEESENMRDILCVFGDAHGVYENRFNPELFTFLKQHQMEVVQSTEPAQFASVISDCSRSAVDIATLDSNDYPQLLRDIPSCPPVLYYRGDLTAANAPLTFAIVGTRRPSAYGMEATQLISKGLAAAGAVLVSGLATGLDSESHKAAIAADMPTIACIAFGHDNCYPSANRQLKHIIEKQGLVISEYPPKTDPRPRFFLQRNRLIAGISRGLCVAEARKASGTMNTVRNALDFGRDVFAVPGSIFSPLCEGTNALLCDGAAPAVSADDILRRYGLETKPQKDKSNEKQHIIFSSEAKNLLDIIGCTPSTFDVLCSKTMLPVPKVMAALTELELAGVINQLAGRQFVLK